MTSLKNPVYAPAVICSNDKLLIVGHTGNSKTCQDVQYLNVVANNIGVHADTIDCGERNGYFQSGIYRTDGGNVSIFGGFETKKSCIQQIASGNKLSSIWNCLSSSESNFEGLEYSLDGSSLNLRYSNFFHSN